MRKAYSTSRVKLNLTTVAALGGIITFELKVSPYITDRRSNSVVSAAEDVIALRYQRR